MKRIVITCAVFVLLVTLVYVAFFTASDFRTDDQSYFASLSDFTFMVGTYNGRFLGLGPPKLNDWNYERFMKHAKKTAHYEVDEVVFWRLEQWGSAVEPRLVEEIERWGRPGRIRAAATVLARRGHHAAIDAFEKAVATGERWLAIRILYELHEVGPEAAPAMIAAHRRSLAAGDPPLYNVLDSIGRAGGSGTDYLLDELASAETDEDILVLQWPLAYTRDVRAARALFELMHHPNIDIRRRSRDAMSQSMGEAAIEPALDFLERETDDYLRSWVIQSILASRTAAASPRAVEYLAPLVTDPVLSWEASYALARIATDPALDILVERARLGSPEEVIGNLEYAGGAGIRILEDFAHHDDAHVRRQVLWKLEELENFDAAPIYRAALADPDAFNRAEAARLLFQTDPLLLGEGLRVWLSELAGEEFHGRIRAPSRRPTRAALGALRVLHWSGLVVSGLVGLLLLTGALRAFEPYKFALVLQFLLMAGIIGDFFFMPDPGAYRWATTARLTLLLGLLFLRDDPLPGETRGRVDRFAVRSLWILAPALLVFGVPPLAEGLRMSLRDFQFTKWVVIVLSALTLLLLEQAVLPWHLFRRGSRFEKVITLALSLAIVSIFVAALGRASPEGDRATMNVLFTLPLVVAVLFHIRSSRLFARYTAPPKLPPAPGRLHATRDRELITVKLRPRRSFRGVPQLALVAIALWFLVVKLDIADGGGAAMVLLILAGVFGIVLAWLVGSIVNPSYTVQIRAGALRFGSSWLGGVLGRARWQRRVRLPAFIRELELSSSEKRWLARALHEDTT